MKFFVITRFNDYFPTFDGIHATSSNHHLGIENWWLERRIEIFLQVTVPSIASQTDKDFEWIIKCHPKTPKWTRKILAGLPLIACYDEIPQQNSTTKQASLSFHRAIRKITDDKEIITSRVDSDDGLSRCYVENAKRHIKPNKFMDFIQGVVKDSNGIYFHFKPTITSQFCSYMDYGTNLLTVYHQYHHLIKNSIKIDGLFGWFQNNHDFNITTEMRKTTGRNYPHKIFKSDMDEVKKKYPFIKTKWAKNDTVKPCLFL